VVASLDEKLPGFLMERLNYIALQERAVEVTPSRRRAAFSHLAPDTPRQKNPWMVAPRLLPVGGYP